MNAFQLFELLPDIIIAAASIVIMIAIAVRRGYLFGFVVTLIGFLASFASLFIIPAGGQLAGILAIDTYSKYFAGLVLLSNLCVAIFSYRYYRGYEENREELYILLLLETLGALVLTQATHFVSFFLGIELLSVSLYALLAYVRTRRTSIEAGLKYLIPAAVSSAIFLFGMALVYRATGSMEFAEVGRSFANAGALAPLLYIGLVMIIVGVAFKLALVPFHMWVADVYQGAGVPITASIATISKVAVFAMVYRLFAGIDIVSHLTLMWVLTGIAVLSMLGGNWLALRQSNVKRMLAYSSTAHLGYLMLPFLAGGTKGVAAAAFYLLAYSATSLGLFGTMSVISDSQGDAETMEDYRGLAWKRPGLAAVMTTMLLSIAGIPLTIGFMGKIYLITSGVGSSLWLLAFVLVASSGIGLFYYLRLVAVQFSTRADYATRSPGSVAPSIAASERRVGAFPGIVLTVLTAAVILFGIFPTPLLSLIGSIVAAI